MRIITATNLPRFMACNGSRLVEGFKPSTDADNSMRDEGDAAHWLIQQVHEGKFQAEELVDRKAPNGVFITAEMVEHTEQFLKAHNGGLILIETDTSFASEKWQVNGRADRIVYSQVENILYIDDFKYGWGIVEPWGNWTLLAHAMGYCFRNCLHPREIRLTIYQPRPHHSDGKVRTWPLDYSLLMKKYEEMNNALSNPSDLLVTSEHCKGCPGYVNCPAARYSTFKAMDVAEMAFTDELDNDTLSLFLDQITYASKKLETAVNAYEELALSRVRLGQRVANYAAETGYSNREWHEGVSVEMMEVLTGKTLSKKKLVTPAQAEKAGVDPSIVNTFASRRPTGVKLTRIDENKKAQKAFGKKGN